MDRELSEEFLRKQRLKKIAQISMGILLIIFIIIGFKSLINPSIDKSILKIAVAEKGTIEESFTASGMVVPEFEQVLTSPIQSRIDSVFHKPGEKINRGKSIVALNTDALMIQFRRQRDEYDLKKNRKVQLQLNLERELIDLKARKDIQLLVIKSLESKLEQEKRLFDIGAGAKMAVRKAGLDLEIAQREKEQIDRQINNKQKSLLVDLKALDLEIQIQKKNMDELEEKIELAKAKAARDGVITWVNENRGSTVNKGDVVARIADLDIFKIEAKISDMHAARLQLGNPVVVRIDQTDLQGIISNIRPTIESGVITFLIELNDKRHPALRSNLRVDVFVITSFIEDVIRVQNGPYVNGSGIQDIFMLEDSKLIRKTVTIGATNFDYVEITDGVNSGDKVIISNMSEYIHHPEISLDEE